MSDIIKQLTKEIEVLKTLDEVSDLWQKYLGKKGSIKSMLKDLVVNQETPLFYENKNLFEKNLGVFVNSYQIEKLKNFK